MKVKCWSELREVLTIAEIDVLDRLRGTYPKVVHTSDLFQRSYDTAWGTPGEWHQKAAGVIHYIRRKLGSSAIESVYEHRIGFLGRPVRGRLIGYRLGPTLTGSL